MRKLSIEITVSEGQEADVRKAMIAKAEQLIDMINSDGPEAFCWSGAANDELGSMKFVISTPSTWVTADQITRRD